MKSKILHIAVLEKFIPPFIDFIEDNLDSSKHIYIILGKKRYKYGLTENHHIVWINSIFKMHILLSYMYKCKKIIIHGLWSEHLNKILLVQPWLLKKCYHVMWGGDFYFPEQQSWVKRQVIKKMGHFVTYIKGDYELAQKYYGATGQYHECFMYPSNLYKDYEVKRTDDKIINIQIGNSADSTNNHLEIFEKLKKYKNDNIRIFVPLSYGEKEYAKDIIKKGKEIFGDKFNPMVDFLSFDKYLDFLGKIDIAIFNHKRQQAMGNTITLLGLGKKVYLRGDVTPWKFFNDIGIKVYDIENINLNNLNNNEKDQNRNKIKDYFSEENYLKQLEFISESQ